MAVGNLAGEKIIVSVNQSPCLIIYRKVKSVKYRFMKFISRGRHIGHASEMSTPNTKFILSALYPPVAMAYLMKSDKV